MQRQKRNLCQKSQISMLTLSLALHSCMLRNVIEKNEGKNTDLVIQNRLTLRVVYLGSPCPIAQAFSVGISWYGPK